PQLFAANNALTFRCSWHVSSGQRNRRLYRGSHQKAKDPQIMSSILFLLGGTVKIFFGVALVSLHYWHRQEACGLGPFPGKVKHPMPQTPEENEKEERAATQNPDPAIEPRPSRSEASNAFEQRRKPPAARRAGRVDHRRPLSSLCACATRHTSPPDRHRR